MVATANFRRMGIPGGLRRPTDVGNVYCAVYAARHRNTADETRRETSARVSSSERARSRPFRPTQKTPRVAVRRRLLNRSRYGDARSADALAGRRSEHNIEGQLDI
jgi:hypothetical protein